MAIYNGSVYDGTTFDGQLSTSKLFKALRPQFVCEIQYTGHEIDTRYNTASSTDVNRFVRFQDLWDGYVLTNKYLLLDGYCKLDGSIKVAGDGVEFGWWSRSVANASGAFDTPPALFLQFVPSVFYNVIIGFYVDEWAVDFDLEFYQDDEQMHVLSVTDNGETIVRLDLVEPVPCNKIVLRVKKWSKPNTVAKVSELWTRYSEYYNENYILSIRLSSVLNEDNIFAGKADELQITLWNDGRFDIGQRLYSLAKQNRIVTLYAIADNTQFVLFKGLSAKIEVRNNKTVQVLAQGVLAQLIDVEGDYPTTGIATNQSVRQLTEALLNKAVEKLPWLQYENNTSETDVIPYYWNSASVRHGLEQIATAKCFKIRERNGKLIIGDTRQEKWYLEDDIALSKSIDRNWNLVTRLNISVFEHVRRQRTEKITVHMDANSETVVTFGHGRLFTQPYVTISSSNIPVTITDIKTYVDHTDVYLRSSSSAGSVEVSVTVDELVQVEQKLKFEHPKILELGARGKEITEWRYLTSETAALFASEHLKYKAEVLRATLPLNTDIAIDDIIITSGSIFEVEEVQHVITATDCFTEIVARAVAVEEQTVEV